MAETEGKPKPWQKTYGLSLNAGDKRFTFKNTDNGITLTDWKLSWTADGKDDSAPLENIASVHLQSGGDFENPLNQCRIVFADGHILSVTDGTAYGTADDAQTAIYREFVQDLHTRLAMAPPGTITFAQGLFSRTLRGGENLRDIAWADVRGAAARVVLLHRRVQGADAAVRRHRFLLGRSIR